MLRDVLVVIAAGVSLVNGMATSPLFDPIFFLIRPFVASVFSGPLVLFYFTSIFISLTTLAIAGVPAAIFERLRGNADSTAASAGIWLVTTLVLTIPGILGYIGYFNIE